MKKIMLTTLILFLVLLSMSCKRASDNVMKVESKITDVKAISAIDEIEEVGDGEMIRIGALNDTPPYVSLVDGELKGIYVDLIEESFKRMNVPYELKDYSFARMLEALKVGKLDVALDIFVTPEREAYALFPLSSPVAEYPYNLFKLKTFNFKFKGTQEELQGQRLGAIRGYSLGNYDVLLNDQRYDFTISDTPKENMEKLLLDRADLVIDVLTTGLENIEKINASDLIEPVYPPININYSYFAFSKEAKREDLMKNFEVALSSMIDDGSVARIYEKYNVEVPNILKK